MTSRLFIVKLNFETRHDSLRRRNQDFFNGAGLNRISMLRGTEIGCKSASSPHLIFRREIFAD
jgi:hypothetical protein